MLFLIRACLKLGSDVCVFFFCAFFFCLDCDHYNHGHRILEIEWAVNNNKEYVPSPKAARRSRRKTKHIPDENLHNEDVIDLDDLKVTGAGKASLFDVTPEFGMEVTNMDSPNRSKRSIAELEDLQARSPIKKQKRAKTPAYEDVIEDGIPVIV